MNNDSNNLGNNNVTVEPVESQNVVTPVAPAPAVQESAPVAPAPAVQESAPVAPAPVVQESAPVAPTSVVQESAPVAPAPVVQESAPVAPAPAVQESAPVAPAPVVQESAPVTPTTPPVEPVVSPTITINGDKVVTTETTEEKGDGTIKAKSGSNTKLIVMLIIIVILAGIFIWLLNKKKTASNPSVPQPVLASSTTSTLIENAIISGSSCVSIGSNEKCSLTIGEETEMQEYSVDVTNKELLFALSDYSDNIKVNVYYKENNGEKTIVDYKIFTNDTNEEISNTITEKELRQRLGLFNEGEYTESLKLVEIGTPGVGMNDDESYTYNSYTFADSNNNTYDMKYKNPPKDLKVVPNNEYTVNFEVTKDIDYEYYIKSIK